MKHFVFIQLILMTLIRTYIELKKIRQVAHQQFQTISCSPTPNLHTNVSVLNSVIWDSYFWNRSRPLKVFYAQSAASVSKRSYYSSIVAYYRSERPQQNSKAFFFLAAGGSYPVFKGPAHRKCTFNWTPSRGKYNSTNNAVKISQSKTGIWHNYNR